MKSITPKREERQQAVHVMDRTPEYASELAFVFALRFNLWPAPTLPQEVMSAPTNPLSGTVLVIQNISWPIKCEA